MAEKIPLKKRKIKWFTWLRITGIVIFIVVLSQVDLAAIWENMLNIEPVYFIIALLFQVLLLIAKGIRWYILNNERNSGIIFKRSMGEFLESYAIGVITPGRLGEFLKTGYQNERGGMLASGVRVIAERGLDVGFFIMVAGAALLWRDMIKFSEFIAVLIFAGGIILMLISILIIKSAGFKKFIISLNKKLDGYIFSASNKNILSITGLTILSNVSAFLTCYSIALGLQMDISLLVLSGGVAIAGLLNILPITVMGLGTRELAFLYLFASYPDNLVLALSALIFVTSQLGGGLLAFLAGQVLLNSIKR
jgi:glycosyltransferase 2 family protein